MHPGRDKFIQGMTVNLPHLPNMVANLATAVHVQRPGLPTRVVAYEALVTCTRGLHTHTHTGEMIASREDTIHMWVYD